MELKKIGVLSFAKVTGIFGLIIGIIQIIALAVLQKYTANLPLEDLNMIQPTEQLTLSLALSVLALSIILYFIVGVLTAFIYNLIAKYIGGIKLEFKETKRKK